MTDEERAILRRCECWLRHEVEATFQKECGYDLWEAVKTALAQSDAEPRDIREALADIRALEVRLAEQKQFNELLADELKQARRAAQSDAEPVRAFAKAVLHGDDEHRAWLTEAAEAFIAGKPLPTPRGKGTKQSDAEPISIDDAREQALSEAYVKGFEDGSSAIAAAIGSSRFMDPPDGGDVSLAEQVTRMRKTLEKSEAALAQSDAEPVAWDRVRRVLEAARICFKSRDQDPVEMKVLAAIEIMLAAPPRPDASVTLDEIEAGMDRVLKRRGFQTTRPDASVGLIEAAQSVQEIAHDFARDIATNCDNDIEAIATLIECAISRSRAADRSGK